MIKNEFSNLNQTSYEAEMDYKEPKTRREPRKDPREKGSGKNGKYTAKHVRQIESLKEKHKSK